MNNLDKFILGQEDIYSFTNKNGEGYGVAKLVYQYRFILLYLCNINNVLGYDNKAVFEGFFDTQAQKLYITDKYFNTLENESEFDKILIHEIQIKMSEEIKQEYNKLIHQNINIFKDKARVKYAEFYKYAENNIVLNEKIEKAYKNNIMKDYIPEFYISVPIAFKDVCDYIESKEDFIEKVITSQLEIENIVIHSEYSGIPSIQVTQQEYIGFKLLEQEAISKGCQDIDDDKNDRSEILKKLRDIKLVCKENDYIKTITIDFLHNAKELEVNYPLDRLEQLDISEFKIPAGLRFEYCKLFNDIDYSGDERRIMAIKRLKYRGKVIYEDENL